MTDSPSAGSFPARSGPAASPALNAPDPIRDHAAAPAPPGEAPAAEPPPPPATRCERLLQRLENAALLLDRLVHAAIPPALNPFAQLGAIANTCLIVALASGIALLLWYTPSVHQAHASLEAIRTGSWLGQLTRSLHRYSSDACLSLVLLHAARIFVQRRFTGPRWIGWATGVALLFLVWVIGWTGYWLVWDVRAQHVAVGTAKFIDRLPLFGEPLARSFLTDQSVHSLLFFLIFFAHMLLPLVVGIALWLHLTRVNRPRLLTGRTMTLWACGSLLLVSALLPATSAAPAQMTLKAPQFTMDWWFLWPLALTDRLGGGALWGLFLFSGVALLTVPWWMVKRRLTPQRLAQVELPRCMGCTLCARDCPFNAITTIPREDGRPFPVQSHVNPALCVGCGVCVGACDSQAINLPWLDSRATGRRIQDWIAAHVPHGAAPHVAFLCAESAALGLAVDADGRCGDLPGYRVCVVPCVGWVSAVILERALQRGARGVLMVGCGAGDPACREGGEWLRQRLAGQREPRFDPKKADPARVHFVQFDRTRRGELLRAAAEFAALTATDAASPLPIRGAEEVSRPRRVLRVAAALALVAILGGGTYALSDWSYRPAHSSGAELVVSFNHRGQPVEQRKLSQAELDKRLPHMRAQIGVGREKAPVRLRVTIDGQPAWSRAYPPRGLKRDGSSMALVRLPVSAGAHTVRVEIGDTPPPDQWPHAWEQTVEFAAGRVVVLLFDAKSGFTLH
jgi:ferredoxin/coenzyme F420-reducing hydrogenase delta subunit